MTLSRLSLASTLLLTIGFIGIARADIITVQGSTSGVFNNGSSTIDHLSFTGTNFGPTSLDALTNLGTFSLDNGTTTYTGDTFSLTVTFTLPPGVSGSTVAGTLTGSVHGNSGSVVVDFNGPVQFTFPGGSFDLTASDVTVSTGVNGTLAGTLSEEYLGSAVPEPASLVLLATCIGIAGIKGRKLLRRP